ncbi:DEAD-domain-containing protein [Dacryopinax primogenitus]|uniref:ATP-dependent RNA helicase DBP2-A n=1 Tax=Dacryopinax primogenitus (strain DJM 731) TaxID=1858805 RepID=M5FNV9_DACPD|nr:DEAD-domain-containing protein [Dacryopinax primogenitus]EJT97985.1 DEAD-domain-containing protein [Dacryopinax primogenitus]
MFRRSLPKPSTALASLRYLRQLNLRSFHISPLVHSAPNARPSNPFASPTGHAHAGGTLSYPSSSLPPRKSSFPTEYVPSGKKTAAMELVKDVYTESEATGQRTMHDVDAFLKENEMTIRLGNGHEPGGATELRKPVLTFEELECIPQELHNTLRKTGFPTPTPIQAQTWPIVLSGKDLIGVAQTGSGKTLSYILPAIAHLRAQPSWRPGQSTSSGFGISPSALILAPTRELATQIAAEAGKYMLSCRMAVVPVYGGADKRMQMNNLRRGADVVVATPGRLNDLIQSNILNLSRISYLVMDEADRMLDMGFEPQIRQIVEHLPPNRQTLLWSATWPKEVQSLARDFINPGGHVHVTVGSHELEANKNVLQRTEHVESSGKPMALQNHLVRILTAQKQAKIIIFVGTKLTADMLHQGLSQGGYPVVTIHGDKTQDARDRSIGHFRAGKAQVLVATDVCARGLDVKDVHTVINYDIPNNPEDYVHRIGRTGRAGSKGEALSFLTDEDAPRADGLIKVIESAGQEPEMWLVQMARDARGNRGGGGQRQWGGGYRRQGGGGYGAGRQGGGGGGGYGGRQGGGYGAGGGGYGRGRTGGSGGGGGGGGYGGNW